MHLAFPAEAHRNIKGLEKVRVGDHVSANGALESV